MTETLLVRADRVVAGDAVIEGGAVLVEDGRIAAVDRANLIKAAQGTPVLTGAVLLPGFVDLHVHGGNGNSFGQGGDAARAAACAMARNGVTTCYAGLGAGATLAEIAASVEGAAEAVGAETGGARIAGIFLEGPFISSEKKGAWTAEYLRKPDVAELRTLIAAGQGAVARVNVAPELRGALAFIEEARSRGVVVSLGHSNATYEEARAGIAAGATIANHTFNAMSSFGHREPGLVGAVLAHDDLLAELILDGVHVHAGAAAALLRARGTAGVALITDASALAGMPDGTYQAGERTISIHDGACRLPDGTLAGSVAPFVQVFRKAAKFFGANLVELAAMSSGNAAAAMGIADDTGSIAVGKYADLAVLSEEFEVEATIVRGQVVFNQGEGSQ